MPLINNQRKWADGPANRLPIRPQATQFRLKKAITAAVALVLVVLIAACTVACSKKVDTNQSSNASVKSDGVVETAVNSQPVKQSLSGDVWLDEQLERIALENGNDLWNCFIFVAEFPYYYDAIYPEGAWEVPFAKEMLINGGGNCYGYAALFCMLARQLGFDAGVISGEVQTYYWTDYGWEPGWTAHAWVEIYYEDEVYVCDPDAKHEVESYHDFFWSTYEYAGLFYRYL